jgi:hypothetical protein
VKFTPDGGSIDVHTANVNGNGLLRVVITDSGMGLTHDELGRIFNTFSKGIMLPAGRQSLVVSVWAWRLRVSLWNCTKGEFLQQVTGAIRARSLRSSSPR